MTDSEPLLNSLPSTEDLGEASWRHCIGRFTGPDSGHLNAFEHYQKHVIVQHEWAEPDPTPDSYARRATAHLNSEQTVELFDPSTAAVVKYSILSNELGLANRGDGHIRTFFRPSRGPDYIEDQIRNGKWLPYRFADADPDSIGNRLSADDVQAEAMETALLRTKSDLEAQEPIVVLDCQSWLHSGLSEHLASVIRFATNVSFLTAMENHARRSAASEQQESIASRISGCQHEWEGVLAALEEVTGPALNAACFEAADAQLSQLMKTSSAALDNFGEEEFEDLLTRRDAVELLLSHLAVRCLEEEQFLVRYLMLRARADGLDHELRKTVTSARPPQRVWEPLGEFWWRKNNKKALPTGQMQVSRKHPIPADAGVTADFIEEEVRASLLRERRTIIEALIKPDADARDEENSLGNSALSQVTPLDHLPDPSANAQAPPRQFKPASAAAPSMYVRLSGIRFTRTYFDSVLIDGNELRGSRLAPDVSVRMFLAIDNESVTLDVAGPEGLVRIGVDGNPAAGLIPLSIGEVSLSIGQTKFTLTVLPVQESAVASVRPASLRPNLSAFSRGLVYLRLTGPNRFRRTYFSDVTVDARELRGSGLPLDADFQLRVSISGDSVTVESSESFEPIELGGEAVASNRAIPLPMGDTALKICQIAFVASVATVPLRRTRPLVPSLMLRLVAPPNFSRTYFEDCILGRSELRGLQPPSDVDVLGERLVEIMIFQEIVTIAPVSSFNSVAVNGERLYVPDIIDLPIGRFALTLGAITLQAELSTIEPPISSLSQNT